MGLENGRRYYIGTRAVLTQYTHTLHTHYTHTHSTHTHTLHRPQYTHTHSTHTHTHTQYTHTQYTHTHSTHTTYTLHTHTVHTHTHSPQYTHSTHTLHTQYNHPYKVSTVAVKELSDIATERDKNMFLEEIRLSKKLGKHCHTLYGLYYYARTDYSAKNSRSTLNNLFMTCCGLLNCRVWMLRPVGWDLTPYRLGCYAL